jgi:phage baseplate assembly protein V
MHGATVTELIRRLEQLLRYGTIAEVDLAAARCRVKSGELLSNWLPWFAQRAGETLHWSPPTVGEQCLLLSPGGDTAAAVAIVGLYSTSAAAPSSSASVHTTHYPDGAVLTYDHASHVLSAVLPFGSSFTVSATTGTLNVDQLTVNADATTWNGPIQLNGHMDATGDVTADGISLMGHKHPGIDRGNSLTDPPQ